jgi:hypothetical protein
MPILTPLQLAHKLQRSFKKLDRILKDDLNKIRQDMKVAEANGTHDLYKRLKLIETQVLKELED